MKDQVRDCLLYTSGDSFVAGVISGILDGLQIEDGIKRGLDFSYQTLDVTGAVNPNIKKGRKTLFNFALIVYINLDMIFRFAQ